MFRLLPNYLSTDAFGDVQQREDLSQSPSNAAFVRSSPNRVTVGSRSGPSQDQPFTSSGSTTSDEETDFIVVTIATKLKAEETPLSNKEALHAPPSVSCTPTCW